MLKESTRSRAGITFETRATSSTKPRSRKTWLYHLTRISAESAQQILKLWLMLTAERSLQDGSNFI